MRVSAVLPAYNAAAHLRETLESLARQTEPLFEVIFVDDGSTDETAAIAEDSPRATRAFGLIRLPHRGLVAALECGLSLARGRYIARMEADDRCHPERLRRQADLLDSRSDLGLVKCLVGFLGKERLHRGCG